MPNRNRASVIFRFSLWSSTFSRAMAIRFSSVMIEIYELATSPTANQGIIVISDCGEPRSIRRLDRPPEPSPKIEFPTCVDPYFIYTIFERRWPEQQIDLFGYVARNPKPPGFTEYTPYGDAELWPWLPAPCCPAILSVRFSRYARSTSRCSPGSLNVFHHSG